MTFDDWGDDAESVVNWDGSSAGGVVGKKAAGLMLNPFTLRDPLEIIVCYSDTFQNNLRIKQKFKRFLKESCWLTILLHFSLNNFAKNAFVRKIFPKLSGLFWPL